MMGYTVGMGVAPPHTVAIVTGVLLHGGSGEQLAISYTYAYVSYNSIKGQLTLICL